MAEDSKRLYSSSHLTDTAKGSSTEEDKSSEAAESPETSEKRNEGQDSRKKSGESKIYMMRDWKKHQSSSADSQGPSEIRKAESEKNGRKRTGKSKGAQKVEAVKRDSRIFDDAEMEEFDHDIDDIDQQAELGAEKSGESEEIRDDAELKGLEEGNSAFSADDSGGSVTSIGRGGGRERKKRALRSSVLRDGLAARSAFGDSQGVESAEEHGVKSVNSEDSDDSETIGKAEKPSGNYIPEDSKGQNLTGVTENPVGASDSDDSTDSEGSRASRFSSSFGENEDFGREELPPDEEESGREEVSPDENTGTDDGERSSVPFAGSDIPRTPPAIAPKWSSRSSASSSSGGSGGSSRRKSGSSGKSSQSSRSSWFRKSSRRAGSRSRKAESCAEASAENQETLGTAETAESSSAAGTGSAHPKKGSHRKRINGVQDIQKKRKRNRTLWILAAVFIVIAAGGGYYLYQLQQNKAAAAAAAETQQSYKVVSTLYQEEVDISGNVTAYDSREPVFKMAGVVENVFVEEGDRVEKGDIIAKLNDAEIQYQLAQLDYEIEQSELQGSLRQLQLNRQERELLEYDVEKTKLYAPLSGTVTRLDVEPGDVVSAGNAAARIVDVSALRATVEVDEYDINAVEEGQKAVVSFDALQNDTEVSAQVESIPVEGEVTSEGIAVK
ncbi:MAG: efflux RND transporter periplasmic adaptor subunit, partial [Spirochaetales bacterium]|nr:efflux RND transporter periplasmic adaptor subunit [Spirochaetales bacterium]